MVTMREVAKEAGVSLGTVSNVLNNVSTVNEENREKVLAAVKKLKYRPNTAARILKTNISHSIGLVIPDITNPYYPELARGVEDAARKYGYTIFLCNNDRDGEKEREYIEVLLEKNVDGIILVKPKVSPEEIEELQERCNVVLVDADDITDYKCELVNVDDYGGAISAMNLLYEYGHKRIAFISGLLESRSSICRQTAYLEFLKEKGLEVDNSLIKKGQYDWYSGYQCTVELLKNLEPPTAIFAANDLMAIGAIKAARERRLNIPFDISVIGYDDIDIAPLCTPQLTTIRQPKYETGTVSVESLMGSMRLSAEERQKCRKVITLETKIILRESVGYVRGV